jgi:hypothetical protein
VERFPARSGKWVTNSPAGGCSWGNDAAQGRAWRRPSARIRAPAMSSWRLASSDASSQFAGSATPATMPALARFGQNGPVEWVTREHGLKPHSHWDRTSGAASAQARRPRRRRDGRRAVLVKEVRRDAEGVGGFPSRRGTRDGAVSEPCSQDRSRLVASPALAASSRPSALGLSIDAPRNAR